MKNYDKADYRDRLAELNVCGCIINNPQLLEDYQVDAEDTTNHVAKSIILAVKSLYAKGTKFITIQNIENELEKEYPSYYRIYQKSQGINFVGQAVTKCYPMNFEADWNTVKKYRALRELIEVCGIDVSEIYDPNDIDDDLGRKKREKYNKMSPEDVIQHFKSKLDSIRIASNKSFVLFDPLTEEVEPEKYLIDGIMMEGTVNAVVAGSKVGKSYFLEEMLFCVENGLPWQGKETTKAHCLLVDYEMTKAKMQKRCLKLMEKYKTIYPEKELKLFDIVLMVDDWDKQSVDGVLRQVRAYKAKHPETKLIGLDPFYRFFDGDDENNNNQVADCIGKIAECKQYDLTFVYAHHTSKYGTKEKDPFLASSGAYAHSKIVDQAFGLMPKDANDIYKGVILTNKGREDNDSYKLSRDEWGFFTIDLEEESKNPMNEKVANLIKKYLSGKKQATGRAKMSTVLKNVPEANGLDYNTYDSFGLQIIKQDGQRFNNWTVKIKDGFGGCGC